MILTYVTISVLNYVTDFLEVGRQPYYAYLGCSLNPGKCVVTLCEFLLHVVIRDGTEETEVSRTHVITISRCQITSSSSKIFSG